MNTHTHCIKVPAAANAVQVVRQAFDTYSQNSNNIAWCNVEEDEVMTLN